MIENDESLIFQLDILKKEGKCIGKTKDRVESQIWDKAEKKLSPVRPRWEVVDSDEGVFFARKDYSEDRVKHMDIIEGEKEFTKEKYKDIIIYETGNEENPVLVRNANVRKKR